MAPWLAPPTMGFLPHNPMQPFRPLHVWGHPTIDQSTMHMWPKHLAHSQSTPRPQWAPPTLTTSPPPPPPLLPDHSYWQAHPHVDTPLNHY